MPRTQENYHVMAKYNFGMYHITTFGNEVKTISLVKQLA